MPRNLLLLLCILFFNKATATDLFWIGHNGNWSDASKWSTTSGGASCNCTPTSNDNVFFDANSFISGQAITIDIIANCKSMNWTGATSPILAGSSALNIYGSLILNASISISYSGNITFKSGSTGNNIQTFGKTLLSYVQFDGPGGGWTFQDNITTTSTIELLTGTLNTNNVIVNASNFASGGSGIRSLTLGSSVLNLSYNSTWAWNVSGTNLTLNAGTSTINLTGSSNFFSTDNRTYYDVNFNSTVNGVLYTGSSTFHNVSFASDASINGDATYNNLSLGTSKTTNISGTETINGTLTANGTCGIPANLTGGAFVKALGTVTINYVRLQNSTATGGATFIANNVTDLGNNNGWTLNTPLPQNLHWVNNGGNWTDPSHWSLTVGGISSGCIPSPYDNVFFDAGSFSISSQTVTIDQVAYSKSMNWTGVTNSPSLAGSSSLNIYGSMVLNASMSIPFSGNITFKATSPGNNIQSFGKTLSSYILFDGAGGGWTLQDNFNTTSTIELTKGSLNTNNATVNGNYFSSGGAGTRSLTLGSSVLNFSFTSTWAWNVSGTNLTINAGTSTINLTGASNYFVTDNRIYYDVNFMGTSSAGFYPGSSAFHNVSFAGDLSISGDGTYNNLTLGTSKSTLISGIETINGTFTANGTCGIPASLSGGTLSKPSGSVTINYVRLQNVTATGGATFIANNTTDLGNNNGWTINQAATQNLHWIGNSGNWTDPAHWSLTTGGASSGCIPSPSDNVFFDAGSFGTATQTVTLDQIAYCKSMNWTGATNNPTLAGSSPLNIYGSLILNASMNIPYSANITFKSTSPGNTIQSFGKALSSYILFNGISGGWTLQDNFTTSSTVEVLNGSFNTNNQTVNASNLTSNSNSIRSITLGSSILNFSYQNTCGWNVGGTNLTLNAGTSTINLTGTTGFFTSDNRSYYDVNFNGAINGTLYSGGSTFHNVSFAGNATLSGSGSYNNLSFGTSKSANISGTEIINGTVTINGTCTIPATLTGGTLSKATGNVTVNYVSIQNSTATGGATFTATNSTDLGGNTGWTLDPLF